MSFYKSKYWNLLFCLLVISSLAGIPLCGQSAVNDYQYLPIEQKTFEESQWQDIQKSLDYSGERPTPEKEEAPKEASKPWDYSLPDLSPVFKIIGIILVIGLLGFVMYHVINGTTNQKIEADVSSNLSNKETELLSLEELEEQLDKRDINPYIRQAEEQNNYPLAIRLHFLALLKKLNEEEQIKWRKNYTNNIYLNQMRGKENYSDFRQLTKEYERIWYGDRHPSRQEYEYLKRNFNQFHLTFETVTQ